MLVAYSYTLYFFGLILMYKVFLSELRFILYDFLKFYSFKSISFIYFINKLNIIQNLRVDWSTLQVGPTCHTQQQYKTFYLPKNSSGPHVIDNANNNDLI